MATSQDQDQRARPSQRQPFVRHHTDCSTSNPDSLDVLDADFAAVSTDQLLSRDHQTSNESSLHGREAQKRQAEEFSQADLRKVRTKQKYFSGRTVSLRFLATCVAVTLGLNLAFFVFARAKGQLPDGTYLVARGQCPKIKVLNTALHAVINVLGILVLAAVSSYLGVLSSPTREDLNRAHRNGTWLEIGIPSWRNLKYLGSLRKWLCISLFFISLPIHILYNSVLYVHLTTTSYYWLVVTEDFLLGAQYSVYNLPMQYDPVTWDGGVMPFAVNKIRSMQSRAQSYTVLDAKDCLQAYSDLYISAYSDVILVSSDINKTNALLAWDETFSDTTSWLCATPQSSDDGEAYPGLTGICNFKHLEKNPQEWTTFGHPIKECLARPESLDCTLQMSPALMIVVLVTNGLLLGLMLFTLTVLWGKARLSLTCFGDVLASYLQVEDEYTRGICLADRRRIDSFWRARGQAAPLHRSARRWNQAMSPGRVKLVVMLLSAGMIAVIICLSYALYIVRSDRQLPITWRGLFELGFGSTSISGDLEMNVEGSSMAGLAIEANIPQIFLAVITLITNAAFVEMTQAAEYAQFASSRKTLRVSVPVGKQRGTYLFSMPLRYAVPVQGIAAALHWTISQSIIPLQVSFLPTDSSMQFDDLFDLAFSPLAIIASTVMAGVLLLSVLIFGLWKLTPPMPLASSCSLALSAAVHPQQPPGFLTDPDSAYKGVQWGVTHYNEDGTGHTSFTSSKHLEIIDEQALYR